MTGHRHEFEIVRSSEAKVNGRMVRGDFFLVNRLEKRDVMSIRKSGTTTTVKDVPIGQFFTMAAAKCFLKYEKGVDLRNVRIRA